MTNQPSRMRAGARIRARRRARRRATPPSPPPTTASAAWACGAYGEGVDLLIDSLGGDFLPRSIGLLKTYGHAINIGEAAGYPDFDIRHKLYENSTSMAGFEVLHAMRRPGLWQKGVDAVLGHLLSGALQMPVEQVFAFDAVHDLHRKLESRTVSGKLLLQVS